MLAATTTWKTKVQPQRSAWSGQQTGEGGQSVSSGSGTLGSAGSVGNMADFDAWDSPEKFYGGKGGDENGEENGGGGEGADGVDGGGGGGDGGSKKKKRDGASTPPAPMDAWMENGPGRSMMDCVQPGASMTLRRGADGEVQLFPIADVVDNLLKEVEKDPAFLDKRRDELAAKFLEGRRMLQAADAAERAAAVAAAAAVQRQRARRATPHVILRRDWTTPGAWVADENDAA